MDISHYTSRRRNGVGFYSVFALLFHTGLATLVSADVHADSDTPSCAKLVQSKQVQSKQVQSTVPQTRLEWEQRHATLVAQRERCGNSAAYLSALGSAELHTGRLDTALISLESALLLDPMQGGAQVDYAQALYLSGQPFAALALNQTLRERSDLPKGLTSHLRERQSRWRRSLASWQHRLETSVGFDTNVNAAPDVQSATLTLPDLAVELPLSSSAQAQSSVTQLLMFSSHYLQALPDEGRREVRLGTTYRATEGDFDSWQSNVRWEEARTYNGHRLRLGGRVQYLRYAGASLYQSVGADVRWQPVAPSRHCWLQANTSLEYQYFPADSHLSGVEAKLGPALQCRLGRTLFAANAGYITQQAEHRDRVGGDRYGWEAGLRMARPLGQGTLMGHMETLHLSDDVGYSPLLGNNTRRRIERYQAQLGYQYPISDSLTLSASGFYREQQSNITLFEFDSTQYQLGLQWRF